ncbi:PfaD family polyunsaturated fatty acid/polyketide biosynthesis protein [Saccharopolyspora erythraea]|uniref:PfaD family polyunsaturated fatty acid/polyketide biosynthesis protein n=1 Tax=Saccharopolyspora erythraea TaxID=1836 RepID=UPI001BA5E827|nr:PfaD family polyunsaturated fatty acid/polyketide biosynthesis protein [Saccharopolyspora erythraea]QUG99416.1 PfaD family polyunsaturated fatty acid/polyketide biosynthesis protein [Saccharopolyspora erythraea]
MTATTAPEASPSPVRTDPPGVYEALRRLDRPCYVVDTGAGYGASNELPADQEQVLAAAGPLPPERLGSSAFGDRHGTRYAYMAGSMAGGVASEDLVIAMARAGLLSSFGSAGLLPERIEKALVRFAEEIPDRPYAVNLIHSPSEEGLERGAVELYLRHGVRCVEASAFMDVTPHLVRYRVAGLERGAQGAPLARNRLIAKVSRPEVAEKFLHPAPPSVVDALAADGLVTAEQAELARHVPLADDVTAEADSGGHTDRRPMPALLPTILRQRDEVRRRQRYRERVGIGAAGGIGTPASATAAFAMGADYVVTGSVNQSCLEAGTSPAVRGLLAGAGIADCEMAPAADMFELGVQLQVLKRGTLFPMRAKQLYELYRDHDGVEALPEAERERLEKSVLRRPVEQVWEEVVGYFRRRDPDQLERAAADPKRRMALIFRWYLGMASRWANTGEAGREQDYQIWCGPAMGAFNEWVRGSHLAEPDDRAVAEVAWQLLRGAAFTSRVHQLQLCGVRLPASCAEYRPEAGDQR